ncbi:hypothetical protein IJJ05_01495 [Candidatus Saccharibacteria bacterium]|nr:hypothetical protein [Candidatus Saccharibacteria bacterium]
MKKLYKQDTDVVACGEDHEKTEVVTTESQTIEDLEEACRLNKKADELEKKIEALSIEAKNLRLQAKKISDRAEELVVLREKDDALQNYEQRGKDAFVRCIVGKKISPDCTGAMKVFPVEDENGEWQVFSSPRIAAFYDANFLIIPVWVKNGYIDHILTAAEAAKYF